MNILKAAAAALLALPVLLTPSVANADEVTNNAANIRKLDIMLMVTSLRCRTGPDDFQPDYRQFSATHLDTLNRAGRTMEADLVHRHGAKGAKRALDTISVGMANEYGQGHPWLGCAELKQVTRDLTKERDVARLSAAATDLLASRPRGGWAMASHK